MMCPLLRRRQPQRRQGLLRLLLLVAWIVVVVLPSPSIVVQAFVVVAYSQPPSSASASTSASSIHTYPLHEGQRSLFLPHNNDQRHRQQQQQHQQQYGPLQSSSHAFGCRGRTTATSLLRCAMAADSSDTEALHESTTSLTLFSPSKINLFLRILRKRDDGYHDLASLFQAISFGDTLELQLLQNDDENNDNTSAVTADEFTCNMPGVPIDSSNLVLRAIQLMRTKTGHTSSYFRANLIKQVPAQAGLGGGSANAATAMWGVNELLGKPATLEQMVEWSAELGSDITFFLSRGTAYCTGRGEIMEPISPPLPSGSTKLCIVKPNIGLSTPSVFRALDYDKLSTLDADNDLLPFFLQSQGRMDQVPDEYFVNDLEFPAFQCLPQLAALKQELLQIPGFDHVLMSGSGTSIFCLGQPNDRQAFIEQIVNQPRPAPATPEEESTTITSVQVFFTEFLSRPEGQWYQAPSTS